MGIDRTTLWLSAALAACSPSAPSPPRAAPPPPPAAYGVKRYLPLEDATVYSYQVQSDQSAAPGLMVVQVRRIDATHAELRIAGRARRLELTPQGARLDEGGWLLKAPLTAGATFPGLSGQVSITSADRAITVPAGHFEHCVETEERSGVRTRTVFCPDIGITELEVESLGEEDQRHELVRLKSHGPAIDLGVTDTVVLPSDQ